jgi:hypothetical protein
MFPQNANLQTAAEISVKIINKMRDKMKIVSILSLLVILSGCTTSQSAPKFSDMQGPEVRADKAILYIFRDYAEPTAFAAHLKIDNLNAASLNQQGFTWVYLEPGIHKFKYSWNFMSGMPTVEFENTFEAGKVYAFQMSGGVSSMGNTIRSTSAIQPIAPDFALEKMKQCCRYVQSKYNAKK